MAKKGFIPRQLTFNYLPPPKITSRKDRIFALFTSLGAALVGMINPQAFPTLAGSQQEKRFRLLPEQLLPTARLESRSPTVGPLRVESFRREPSLITQWTGTIE